MRELQASRASCLCEQRQRWDRWRCCLPRRDSRCCSHEPRCDRRIQLAGASVKQTWARGTRQRWPWRSLLARCSSTGALRQQLCAGWCESTRYTRTVNLHMRASSVIHNRLTYQSFRVMASELASSSMKGAPDCSCICRWLQFSLGSLEVAQELACLRLRMQAAFAVRAHSAESALPPMLAAAVDAAATLFSLESNLMGGSGNAQHGALSAAPPARGRGRGRHFNMAPQQHFAAPRHNYGGAAFAQQQHTAGYGHQHANQQYAHHQGGGRSRRRGGRQNNGGYGSMQPPAPSSHGGDEYAQFGGQHAGSGGGSQNGDAGGGNRGRGGRRGGGRGGRGGKRGGRNGRGGFSMQAVTRDL